MAGGLGEAQYKDRKNVTFIIFFCFIDAVNQRVVNVLYSR
jgi:hypothetical protein